MKTSRAALCATILSLAAVIGMVTAPPAHAANHAPYVPNYLRIVQPRNGPCAPASAPTVIMYAPLLEARLTDTDGPVAWIAARFEVFRIDTGARVWAGVTHSVRNGERVQFWVNPYKAVDPLTYRYRVRAEDGSLVSPWSGYCYFRVDSRAPISYNLTSTDYPFFSESSLDKAYGKPGMPGKFHVEFTPGDTVQLQYRLNQDPPQVFRPTATQGETTLTVTPRAYGRNVLYVTAVDAAGNAQKPSSYWPFRVGGAPGPTGEWRFDETSGDVASDSVGDRDLTWRGSPAWDVSGRLDGAMRLDDVGDSARTSAVVDTSKSFSVSAWVRVTGQADQARLVSQLNSSAHGFAVSYAQNRWTFGRNGSTGGRTVKATKDAVRGHWAHLLAVYDAITGKQRLYVNGLLQGEVAGLPAGASSGDLVVGGQVAASVDHLQVWPRVVLEDEVIPLFQVRDAEQEPRPELLAHWKFDGGPGTGTDDSSGNGHRLTAGPDAGWLEDPTRGGVLRLNATGTNGSARTEGALFDGSSSFTVMAWVRMSDAAGRGTLVGQEGTAPTGFAPVPTFELGVRNPSANQYQWWFVRSKPGIPVDVRGPSCCDWGKWFHLAIVYDSARKSIGAYYQGRGAGAEHLPDSWHSDAPLALGKVLATSPLRRPFVGDVDDVRVYAGNLTRAQIQQAMAATD